MTEAVFLDHINQSRNIIWKLLHLYLQSEEEKQDLFQEILLQCWSGRMNFRGESKASTWIYKVALFTILSLKRKTNKQQYVELSENESRKLVSGSESLADQSEALYKAIQSLKEIDKTIITMHLDGFSNPEIAEFLGVQSNNLNVKLHRIKELLKKRLSNE